MNKKFFVDSNILSLKVKPNKTAVNLILFIFSDIGNDYFINETVFSEIYYQLIVKGKLSSRQKESDSIILSSVKHYKLDGLISLDADFTDISEKENIQIINSSEKLKSIVMEK